MSKIKRRTVLITVFSLCLFFVSAMLFCYWWVFYKIEVDSNAENAPVRTRKIPLKRKVLLPDELDLAAGFAYDSYNNRFFISTDQPHSISGPKQVKIYCVSRDFQKILAELTINQSADLEGIVITGKNSIKALSDSGELFSITIDGLTMKVDERKTIFTDNKSHKTGSLAFDGEYLYTAEKEGQNRFYKLSLNGVILEEFELSGFERAESFTVAGMTFINGYLYILSEAYSTIFKADPVQKNIVEGYGILNMNECSGLTTDGTHFYTVGDNEKYIPEQYFYVFELE